jgi:hypothetical protein
MDLFFLELDAAWRFDTSGRSHQMGRPRPYCVPMLAQFVQTPDLESAPCVASAFGAPSDSVGATRRLHPPIEAA